jgi:hypothetical protein
MDARQVSEALKAKVGSFDRVEQGKVSARLGEAPIERRIIKKTDRKKKGLKRMAMGLKGRIHAYTELDRNADKRDTQRR